MSYILKLESGIIACVGLLRGELKQLVKVKDKEIMESEINEREREEK